MSLHACSTLTFWTFSYGNALPLTALATKDPIKTSADVKARAAKLERRMERWTRAAAKRQDRRHVRGGRFGAR